MLTYRGFNTIDQVKKFRLSGIDLVKRDLLNNFQIRKGEKLMQPNFGSIIWNLLYDPLDEETRTLIINDVKTIVGYDPRLTINEVIIQQLEYGLQLQISLVYKPSNTTAQMNLTFDGQTDRVTDTTPTAS
jgi:phage baseplate assembly protein W